MSSTIDGIKDSFSSWDKCMSKAYCKWPVIVAIIVVSLIVFSLLWCFARCLCCGAECACCCFRCCAGCCGSGRNKKHKHLDSTPNTPYGGAAGLPMYNQQYHSAPQPAFSAPPQQNPYGQTATFESKVHEDSLPAMPSWESATSKRVVVEEDAKPLAADGESHELEKLNPSAVNASSPDLVMPGYAAPQPTRPVAVANLPHSPYDERESFLGAHNGQQSGVMGQHEDSHSGYRGASANPGQIGLGYAGYRGNNYNDSRQDVNNSRQTFGTSAHDFGGSQQQFGAGYNDSRQGFSDQRQYGNDRYYNNSQPNLHRNFSGGTNHTVSPIYSGTTAYDHDQGRGPNGGYPQQPSYGHDQQRQGPGYPTYGNEQPQRQDPGYQAYSPVNGQPRKPVNGSWKDV